MLDSSKNHGIKNAKKELVNGDDKVKNDKNGGDDGTKDKQNDKNNMSSNGKQKADDGDTKDQMKNKNSNQNVTLSQLGWSVSHVLESRISIEQYRKIKNLAHTG